MENSLDKRLGQLLESYGADRARWPEADRRLLLESDSATAAEARALDWLLAMASAPAVPDGALARLMDLLGDEPGARIIPFRPTTRRPAGYFRYAAALPLAASLALGIYLGAQGSLDFILPAPLTEGVAVIDDAPDDLGGVGEADAYAAETLT